MEDEAVVESPSVGDTQEDKMTNLAERMTKAIYELQSIANEMKNPSGASGGKYRRTRRHRKAKRSRKTRM